MSVNLNEYELLAWPSVVGRYTGLPFTRTKKIPRVLYSLTTNQFSLTTKDRSFGNKASDETKEINSFANHFCNDITFVNKENLLHIYRFAKNLTFHRLWVKIWKFPDLMQNSQTVP